MKIDKTDVFILEALQKNGRLTIKELSNQLQLSPTPTFERIKKLERAGVIDRYEAVVNANMIGKKLYAFSHISLKDHTKEKVNEFTAQIEKIPEVQECHYVTGDSDFILKILLKNMEDYKEFMMEQLFDMKNIAKVESYLSLSVLKQNNFISIKPSSES